MSAGLLPAAAVAVWAGILLRPVGATAAAAGALVLGLAGLCLAAAPAWRPAPVPDALSTAGLVDEPGPLEAVAPVRRAGGRGPPWLALFLGLAALVAVGAGLEGLRLWRLERSPLAELAPREVTVVATLRTDASLGRFGWSAVADVTEVDSEAGRVRLREAVWLRGGEDAPDVGRGDLVLIEGALLDADEGFGSFLSDRGIAVELRASEVELLGPPPNPFLRAALGVKRALSDSIDRLFAPREAGLLLGLALGDDSGLHPELERDFRATGLSHLLVVSGGNVAMVLAPVLALAVLLHAAAWARLAVGIGTVAFFAAMTGFEPSVLRAGVMAGIGLAGVFLGRPRSTASTLGGAVLVLLLLDPSLARAVGFQLSVAATAGMVALASPLARKLPFLPGPVAAAAGATLAAQAAVSPLLLSYFREVPLATIVANVLAFPAVAPALLLGLAAAGVGTFWETGGRLLTPLAELPLRYLEAVADRLARAPIAWVTSEGGAATLVVGTAIVVAAAWWIRSHRRAPRAVIVVGLVAAPLVVVSIGARAGPPDVLTVDVLDVGQGDAALVRSPGGATVLIDGGPDEGTVATKLVALGVRRIDVLVASHAHADHVAGLPAVMARLPVGLVIEPGCEDDSPEYAEFLAAVRDEALPVRHPRAGDVLTVGDLRLVVLAPAECWEGTASDTNNDSLVIRLEHDDGTVLLPGDAEEPSQQWLLDVGAPLTVDLLKVPHHGGATSIAPFFEAVGADVAVVSVGEQNDYGHPVPEILAQLSAAGAAVLRTDRAGDVVVSFEPEGPLVASAA